jgi:hypothetical protein
MPRPFLLPVALIIALLSACGGPPEPPEKAAGQQASGLPRELEWEEMMPADYDPEEVLDRIYGEDMGDLGDDDPRAGEALAELRDAWNQAPVVEALDGQRVRLPGFVVPLEGDGERVSQFLLVPYLGACIHVPPPPANQTVYVQTESPEGVPAGLFDAVWVTGILSARRYSGTLAQAGYSLRSTRVEHYEVE